MTAETDASETARRGRRWPSWRRVGAIARVLRRHEIGVAAVRALVATDTSPETVARTAARLRAALEELGPTFVKFGQMLRQRPDLLPQAAIAELWRLEDAVRPFPSDGARAVVEREFGERIERLFTAFEDAPLAAASITRVHRATLHDGSRVAVKIQRPGLRPTIEADLQLLGSLAHQTALCIPAVGPLAPVDLVAEFADSLRRELDFRLEAQAAREVAAALADEPELSVPGVIEVLSSERVLTTRYSSGRKLGTEWQREPHARRRIADLLLRTYLRQVVEVGVFHGMKPFATSKMPRGTRTRCALDRLSLALVTAAFLSAAAVVMTSHVEPHWRGVPWLAWIGNAIAAALAFGWARAVWRAGRP